MDVLSFLGLFTGSTLDAFVVVEAVDGHFGISGTETFDRWASEPLECLLLLTVQVDGSELVSVSDMAGGEASRGVDPSGVLDKLRKRPPCCESPSAEVLPDLILRKVSLARF